MSTTLQARVLDRLRRYVETHDIPHRVLADHLGVTRSAASRILAGQSALTLDYLERLAFFLQESPAELVADVGAVIQPTSPLEADLLARFRKMTQAERLSLLTVLDWQRGQPSATKRAGRAPRLSAEQETLLALYAASPDEIKTAVVGVLREHPAGRLAAALHRPPTAPGRRE